MFTLEGKYGKATVTIDMVEPECIAHIIQMLNHPSFTGNVSIMPDCLTEDSEALTINGFIPITDLTSKDLIANYDEKSGTIFFAPPKSVIIRPMRPDEIVYVYGSKQHNFEFEVSEKHRMAIFNRMGELSKNIDKAVMSDIVFYANEIEDKYTINKYSDNDIRIIAWLVGDGSIKVTHNVKSDNDRIRFGLSKDRKIKRILSLLNEEKLNYWTGSGSNNSTDILINTKDSQKYIEYIGPDKVYPKDFILLNSHQAAVLIDEMVRIDGDYESYKRTGGYRISSTSRYNIDIISALLSLNGYYSKINYKECETEYGLLKMFYIKGIHKSKLSYCRSGLHNRKITRKVSDYKGRLVCIECDSSFFIARQKGLTFVTGNCHEGKGSVVGFTMPMTDTIIPNVIGVDINCGMLSCKLDKITFDGKNLFCSNYAISPSDIDDDIRRFIPFGKNVGGVYYNMEKQFPWKEATELNRRFVMSLERKTGEKMPHTEYTYEWFTDKCIQVGMNIKRAEDSIGTLGGGNHFCEINQSLTDKSIWVTVHSGSRQFGKCICEYWQKEPLRKYTADIQERFRTGVAEIRKTMKGQEIQIGITRLKQYLGMDKPKISDDMAALSGADKYGYLTDMIFTSMYARENRSLIMGVIVADVFMTETLESIETVHNYIDFNDFIIRKGAIAAYEGQKCIIPFNMEDGILICEGKSNPDWNFSAPHGAGRVMSRANAKKSIDANAVKSRMESKNIYSSSIPVDEMKEAYKDPKMIEEAIGPTVKIVDRLIPIMNLKDGKSEE